MDSHHVSAAYKAAAFLVKLIPCFPYETRTRFAWLKTKRLNPWSNGNCVAVKGLEPITLAYETSVMPFHYTTIAASLGFEPK